LNSPLNQITQCLPSQSRARLFERSSKRVSPGEPTRTQVLVALAAVLEKGKKLDEAEKLLREELAAAKEQLGIKTAPTLSLASVLIDMLERTGQKDKAANVRKDHGLKSTLR
jgi:hypothetical protein